MEIIELGKYWKETGLENMSIQWLVLEKTDDYIFLLSKESIVSKAFDECGSGWEDSDIRRWLNNEFMHLVFNEYEKYCILEKEIITTVESGVIWEGICRNEKIVTTDDKVFLLSAEEIEQFFSTQNSRIAEQSQHAINTLEDNRKSTNSWWLRNWGIYNITPLMILEDGSYTYLAASDNLEEIRPAMYIRRNYYELIPSEEQLGLFDAL